MNKRQKSQLVVILGPTAVGKTSLAVSLAKEINGEVISADSRQVYRGMDLGTGKDLAEYELKGEKVPYHLIDILDAGEAYDVFNFQKDFYRVYEEVIQREKVPILCGGTGLYLESALQKKQYLEVKEDKKLRSELEAKELPELELLLKELKKDIHNTTDLTDKNRLIRAIEIALFEKNNEAKNSPISDHIIFGIQMDREHLRGRIKERLEDRFKQGMINEVKELLESGISAEVLNYYGLEYRYISRFLIGQLSFEEMNDKLLQEIRRFAKRQMTWFRRMEKQGHKIHWIDSDLKHDEKLHFILEKL